ncbi:MAG: patatin-like phospholipase family protein [Dehalococcoidia bacterium]
MSYYGSADGVFEGGGAKGIALVGALAVAQEYVTQWESLAGTSAGAITAALLAAGYQPAQIGDLLTGKGIDGVIGPVKLSDLPRRRSLGGIPFVSPAVNLFAHLGMYSGDYFLEVMETLLAGGPRPIQRFGDVRARPEDVRDGHPEYRLQFVASDVTHRKATIIPQGLRDLGLDPDEVRIGLGIRMSMAIPFYFEPVVLSTTSPPTVIVDGGFLSNFPIWLFDSARKARWPTIGFLLDEQRKFAYRRLGVAQLARRIVDTSMGGLNDVLLDRMGAGRTVAMNVSGYRTTEFGMSEERVRELLKRGRDAATAFFARFDPAEYRNSLGQGLTADALREARR